MAKPKIRMRQIQLEYEELNDFARIELDTRETKQRVKMEELVVSPDITLEFDKTGRLTGIQVLRAKETLPGHLLKPYNAKKRAAA